MFMQEALWRPYEEALVPGEYRLLRQMHRFIQQLQQRYLSESEALIVH